MEEMEESERNGLELEENERLMVRKWGCQKRSQEVLNAYSVFEMHEEEMGRNQNSHVD